MHPFYGKGRGDASESANADPIPGRRSRFGTRRGIVSPLYFRAAAWLQGGLFACVARCLVGCPAANQKTPFLALDDTTHKKTGRKVDGARVLS